MENVNDDAILASFEAYKKSQDPSKGGNFVQKIDILKKFFEPRNEKETFRILPLKEKNQKVVEEVYFHVVSVNNGIDTATGRAKKRHGVKVLCLAKNNPKVPKLDANGNPMLDIHGSPIMVHERCPLCEKSAAIKAKQDKSLIGKKKEELTPSQLVSYEKNSELFKQASAIEAKVFYVIRGIDKGAEKDGVKFWRFKHNFKNQGTLNKLMPALQDYYEENGDFTNVQTGCDLSIRTSKTSFSNGSTSIIYTQIDNINTKKAPLHSDELVIKQWLSDNTTWRDVYKAKKAPNINEVQYMEFLAEGNDPYFDKSVEANKHWVFPSRPDLELLANTRDRNLESDDEYSDHEEYSNEEAISGNVQGVTIENIKSTDVTNSETSSNSLGGTTFGVEDDLPF